MRDFAKNRDLKVLDGIVRHKYLRSDQIADMFFMSIAKKEYRVKKADSRLKILFDSGLVQRMRFRGEPYIYHHNGSAYSHKITHYLTIAEVWLILKELCPTGTVLHYEAEKNFDGLITDLYIESNNEFRKERKQYFIEIELESNGDIENKINKYSYLFKRRQREKITGDTLYILHKKKSVAGKLEGYKNEMNLKLLNIHELHKWEW